MTGRPRPARATWSFVPATSIVEAVQSAPAIHVPPISEDRCNATLRSQTFATGMRFRGRSPPVGRCWRGFLEDRELAVQQGRRHEMAVALGHALADEVGRSLEVDQSHAWPIADD